MKSINYFFEISSWVSLLPPFSFVAHHCLFVAMESLFYQQLAMLPHQSEADSFPFPQFLWTPCRHHRHCHCVALLLRHTHYGLPSLRVTCLCIFSPRVPPALRLHRMLSPCSPLLDHLGMPRPKKERETRGKEKESDMVDPTDQCVYSLQPILLVASMDASITEICYIRFGDK
jgi:hypothetical protein